MALGYVTITEYAYRGDPAVNIPVEPYTLKQTIAIGSVSNEFHADTQIVAISASRPCQILFFAGDSWNDGDDTPEGGWPIAESTEVLRRVPMNTGMRVAANPEGAM